MQFREHLAVLTYCLWFACAAASPSADAEGASFLDEARRLVIVGNPNSGPAAIRLVNDSLFLDGVED